MSVLVALTVGLVFWLVAWSLGVKAFDAFMVTMLLVLIAATARIMTPTIQKILKP
jgi:uncharacterized integral membrane protein